MQGAEQKVPAPIAREDAPRTIPSVRRRGKPDDQESCIGIAEARNRLAPILLVAVPADLLARHALPVCHEARTLAAGNHRRVQPLEWLLPPSIHGFARSLLCIFALRLASPTWAITGPEIPPTPPFAKGARGDLRSLTPPKMWYPVPSGASWASDLATRFARGPRASRPAGIVQGPETGKRCGGGPDW